MDEDDAVFRRKYNHAHARMTAYKDIIELVDSASSKIEAIKKQLEVVTKNYGI